MPSTTRQPGTPQTESTMVQGPVPLVLLLVGGGFGWSTTSWRRIWMVYHKLEEDLDHLLQVRGGFGSSTTSRRRTSRHPSKGSRLRWLLRLHQWCTTRIKRPPGLDGASNLVGQARASEGHGVLQATRRSPLFCAFNLVGRARASDGHRVLQATRLKGSMDQEGGWIGPFSISKTR
jgi:hypothetical protein